MNTRASGKHVHEAPKVDGEEHQNGRFGFSCAIILRRLGITESTRSVIREGKNESVWLEEVLKSG
jgi:hypothetical protein